MPESKQQVSFADVFPDQQSLISCIPIRFGQSCGTAFFVRSKGRQFVATAAHVVHGMQTCDNFAFQFNGEWNLVPCRAIERCEKGTDIAIFRGDDKFHQFFGGRGFDAEQLDPGVFLGGSVAYLGYPLGLNVSAGIAKDGTFSEEEPRAQLHMPFLKKGCVGGMVRQEWGIEIYVDTLINKGFSGGPLIYNVARPGRAQQIQVAGIVVRYHYDSEAHVYLRKPDGTTERQNHSFVLPNSGYAIAIGSMRIKSMLNSIE